MASAQVARDEPHPKANEPEPAPPITLALMRRVVLDAATDIRVEQAQRVQVGWRKEPDPMEIERARVLFKTGELLDRLKGNPQAMALLGFRAAKQDQAEG